MDKNAFIDFLLKQGALKFGDFVTKSVRNTPYFVNMGEFGTGAAIAKLGQFYADHIHDMICEDKLPKRIDCVFGPAYKGIPLCVSATSALATSYDLNFGWTFNRKEAKDHGEGGSLVGTKLKDGDTVIIIDDVITAGTAVREVMPVLKAAADVNVVGMIIAVDRMERGTGLLSAVGEVQEEFEFPVLPIITVKDILDMDISADLKSRITLYLEEYGV